MGEVDALIITALKEEYEAARAAGLAGYGGIPVSRPGKNVSRSP